METIFIASTLPYSRLTYGLNVEHFESVLQFHQLILQGLHGALPCEFRGCSVVVLAVLRKCNQARLSWVLSSFQHGVFTGKFLKAGRNLLKI